MDSLRLRGLSRVGVFCDGALVDKYEDKALVDDDFWHVGGINWSGAVIDVVDSVSSGLP